MRKRERDAIEKLIAKVDRQIIKAEREREDLDTGDKRGGLKPLESEQYICEERSI